MSNPRLTRTLASIAGAALIAAGSLVATAPAFADVPDTYFVDPEGSDAAAGTQEEPFETFAHAVDVAVDGDFIVLEPGEYAGVNISESLTINGWNAGSPAETWAGTVTTSVLTGNFQVSDVVEIAGVEFTGSVVLNHGAEGSYIHEDLFREGDPQLALAGLDGTPTTTIEDSTFLLFGTSGQPNAILSSSASGFDVLDNAFYGSTTYDNSVAVNLIGGSIDNVLVEGNVSHGMGNFVVANGNDATGVNDLTVTGNSVHDSVGSAVYIGDNVNELDITGNLFEGGASNGVSFTYYTETPELGGTGPTVDVHDNTFVGNLRGIRVADGAINHAIDARGNRFAGNGTAVLNLEGFGVDASLSIWSVPTGPLATGVDAVTGNVTKTPVGSLGAPFSGGTVTQAGLTSTVHLGAAFANAWFVIGGYGAPSTFAWTQADGSGDATVVWPAGTPAGTQKIAVLSGLPGTVAYISTTLAAPTSNTATPVPGISGLAKVGHTLTAIPRTWLPAGATLALQWNADGAPIADATTSQLVLTPALVGKKISLTVTGSRPGEAGISKTSPQTAAVAPGTITPVRPVVTGSHAVGSKLEADAGSWQPGDIPIELTFRWLRDGVNISGATNDFYTQTSADLGHVIQVRVAGVSPGYTKATSTSSAPGPTKAKLVTLPSAITIPAVAQVGTKISITKTGNYQSGAVLTYSWKVAGKPVAGATSSTFTPRNADIGKTVRVTVTATKTGQTPASITSNSSNLVIKGVFTTAPAPVVVGAQVGTASTVSLGTWAPKPTSYKYQWILDGADIIGATSATYTPTGAQQGHVLKVRVTGVRSGFTGTIMTSAGVTVAVGIFKTTAKPKITGTAKVGKVLTATAPGWAPAAQFAYQWTLNGVPIVGAVDNIYTVSSEDIGGRLRVTVTGARAGFTSATETSNPTAPVAP